MSSRTARAKSPDETPLTTLHYLLFRPRPAWTNDFNPSLIAVFGELTCYVGPVVLGSGELRELRTSVETAVYSTGNREVTLRHAEFAGALELVDAMLAARQAA